MLFLGDMGGERLDDVDEDADDADEVEDERVCTIDSMSLIFDLTLLLVSPFAVGLITAVEVASAAVSMSTIFELSCNDLLIDLLLPDDDEIFTLFVPVWCARFDDDEVVDFIASTLASEIV